MKTDTPIRMRLNKSILLLMTVMVVNLGAGAVRASEEHGSHAADSAPAAHVTCGEGECDHYSLFGSFVRSLVPEATRQNIQNALGKTFIDKKPVRKSDHVIMAAVVFLLLLFLGIKAHAKLKNTEDCVIPPKKFSAYIFVELLVNGLLNMMIPIMGEKYARKSLPLIGALAFFIFFSNILGMIPGFLPPTDTLNTTFALGIIVFLMTHVWGVQQHGLAYFKHFLGPIIKWYALPLMLLMLIIETISHCVRPCSLALRLMGNIFGDHKVLGIFLVLVPILVPLPIMLLGLLVAIVQTLVFCLLSMVYIGLAVEESEHSH